MEADAKRLIPLVQAAEADEALVGSKAVQLGRLARIGHRVPDGYVLTTRACEGFFREARPADSIRMELGRKPLAEMRREKIWDTALRIRLAFLGAAMPRPVAELVGREEDLVEGRPILAVQSSAPGEDSAATSFAGLRGGAPIAASRFAAVAAAGAGGLGREPGP